MSDSLFDLGNGEFASPTTRRVGWENRGRMTTIHEAVARGRIYCREKGLEPSHVVMSFSTYRCLVNELRADKGLPPFSEEEQVPVEVYECMGLPIFICILMPTGGGGYLKVEGK
jgi:hypothetical protein